MKKVLLLAALAATATSAHAAVSIQTQNFSFIPNGSQALTFDKLSLASGEVVTSIQIDVEYTKSGGSLGVDNESVEPGTGTIAQSIVVDLSSLNSLTTVSLGTAGQNLTATTVSPTLNLAADDGDGAGFQPTGPDAAEVSFGSLFVSSSDLIHSAAWSQYIGTGSFDIDVNALQSNDTSTFGGASGTFTPASIAGLVRVTYTTNYSPVPEPSTTALVGLLGAGALLRRRRA